LTTKYNFLFNGNNLYAEGLDDLENNVSENFWELIPVEKFKFYAVDDEDRETNFTRSEEKATLAIQKHSMNVKGKERNPIMDQAYFLLGKSRYFDNRFIPALEAFNYILYKYPTSDYINEIKIWKEKINIRLDQNKYAIENLKELLEQRLSNEERSIANSYIAQAFINIEELDSAAHYLKISKNSSKVKKENLRKTFLLAQVYEKLFVNDTAYSLYSEIIDLNRKIPREFYVNSFIKRSMVSTSIDSSIVELKLLSENFENNNFLDVIYHQIAILNLKKQEYPEVDNDVNKKLDSTAVVFFNKSLREDSDDEFLIAKNYNELAELNFRNKEYLQAGLYYDSTLSELSSKSREFRKIKRKRDNLNDLIFYENMSMDLDSIIQLVKMSKDQREEYFTDFIKNLESNQEKTKKRSENFGNSNSLQSNSSSEIALFYFYNPTAVSYGKNDFKSRWGNRRLEDNWRWSISPNNLEGKKIKNNSLALNKDSIFSVNYYIARIPKDPLVIDSIINRRNDAYFRLGAIYKDQFEEFYTSNIKLFELLQSDPLKSLVPPSKYFIYKNFLKLDSLEKAGKYRKDIIENHSKSKYAAILLDNKKELNDERRPVDIYEELYSKYDNENYLEVINECDKNILNFTGDPIVSKFEFLKALAIARLYGFNQYEKALSFIKMNYSNSPEGKEAEIILSELLPTIKNDQFFDNKLSDNYKIIFKFDTKSKDQRINLIEQLNNYIENIDYLDLRVSEDFYNNIITFVVVHGLKSFDGSLGLAERLESAIDIQADSFFVASSDNYKTIQIHKNLDKFDN